MSNFDEIQDGLIMKHHDPVGIAVLKMPVTTGMILLLIIQLYGCAVEKPKAIGTAINNPVVAVAVIAPDVRADFDSAMNHIKAEEYDAGIEQLSKVVKAAPNIAIPSIDLALAYKKTGKMKLAEDSLKQALNAEPDNPVANNELALLYRKTGRFAEARKVYEKILEKYPNFRMAHKNLGILCDLYMRDYQCALKQYEYCSDVVQDDKTVKIWIADLQNRIGKKE